MKTILTPFVEIQSSYLKLQDGKMVLFKTPLNVLGYMWNAEIVGVEVDKW